MSEPIVIQNDGTVIPESSYGVLPDNTKVQVTILPTNKGGNAIVKRPYAKQGANAALTALAVRVSIDDGQKGAKRNLFQDVALSRKFASGAANYTFASFFRSLGYDIDGPSFTVPDDRELIGKKLEVVIGVDESGDEPRNTIKFINRANGPVALQATRASETGQRAGGGTIAPPWTPGQQAATAPAATPVAAGFTPPGASDAWKVSAEEASAAIQQYSPADGGGKSF